MQSTERPAQRFEFPFVCVVLSFNQLQRFQHLFHVNESFPKAADDLIDVVNGVLNGRWRRVLPLLAGRNGEI